MVTTHHDHMILKDQNASCDGMSLPILNQVPVVVFLATYNGERYIEEQIKSILQQTYPNVKIIASDDGSTDQTLDILRRYSIEVHQGPRQGCGPNFLSLFEKVKEPCAYYAFADQDDVWVPNKIERALQCLNSIKPEDPALYCTRTLLVDEHLTFIGYSPLFTKPPSFLNALVQNIGGGNTMVFNQGAFNLLLQTKNKSQIALHDWWTYLLISGAGGSVFYDSIPSLYYRQHQDNLVGSNMNWRARFHRIHLLFQGRLKSWIDQNNKNLLDVAHLLTPKHRRQLERFESSRCRWFIPRLTHMMQLGIYRQTTLSQIGLLVGAIFNKI